MAKKDKRRQRPVNSLEDAIQEHGPLLPEGFKAPEPTPYQRDQQTPPMSLADIRTEALKAHANVAHTIADLEAWAAEIAATIAFLKERGR